MFQYFIKWLFDCFSLLFGHHKYLYQKGNICIFNATNNLLKLKEEFWHGLFGLMFCDLTIIGLQRFTQDHSKNRTNEESTALPVMFSCFAEPCISS